MYMKTRQDICIKGAGYIYIINCINATYVRACRGNMVSPHASCIDCCIRHSNGTRAGPEMLLA